MKILDNIKLSFLQFLIGFSSIFIFSQNICEEFEVSYLIATKLNEKELLVRVDLYEDVVKYVFVKRSEKWFIQKYEKHS